MPTAELDDEQTQRLSPMQPVTSGPLTTDRDWADRGRRNRALRLSPFVLLCLFAYPLAAMMPGASEHRKGLALAVILILTVGVQALTIPWQLLPPVVRQLPVLTLCLSVVALREATGGSADGYGMVLLLIPVIWQGLYGRRIDVAFTIATIALCLVLTPVFMTGYPAMTELARGLLMVLVAITLGGVLQGLIERVRANDEALRQIGAVSRLLHSSMDPRHVLCDSLLPLTGSAVVIVSEPLAGRLTLTAAEGELVLAGEPIEPSDLHQAASEGITEAMQLGDLVLVAGTPPAATRGRPSRMPSDVGSVDQLHVPIGAPGSPLGVVSVFWSGAGQAPPFGTLRGLALLGTDAGLAIEKADLVRALADQANKDGLTGISNRRAWDVLLPREVADAQRFNRPLSVAIVDLDHFKDYNDRFGHLAGDDLLRDAVRAWVSVLRPGDVLARWGGEEFALVFLGATGPNAARALQRLRGVTPGGISFSAGVAELEPDDDAKALLARADQAMYAAKAAGRDRIVVAREPERDDPGEVAFLSL